jgi:hypothetical protein
VCDVRCATVRLHVPWVSSDVSVRALLCESFCDACKAGTWGHVHMGTAALFTCKLYFLETLKQSGCGNQDTRTRQLILKCSGLVKPYSWERRCSIVPHLTPLCLRPVLRLLAADGQAELLAGLRYVTRQSGHWKPPPVRRSSARWPGLAFAWSWPSPLTHEQWYWLALAR